MNHFSSYRLIEIDENDDVWEVLDELTDSVLVDQERSDIGAVTIGFAPIEFFGTEIQNWH